jgi:ribosome recycling factor
MFRFSPNIYHSLKTSCKSTENLILRVNKTYLLARKVPRCVASFCSSPILFAPKKDKKSNSASTESSSGSNAAGSSDESVDDEFNSIDPKEVKIQMQKQIEYLKREFSKLRGSTTSPSMLDHVIVKAYGENQALPSLAQISLKNAQLLIINPFDVSLSTTISDAIRDTSGLNLNPQVDTTSNSIKVTIPKTSQETRDNTLKVIGKLAETVKTRIRRVRQSTQEKIKKLEGISKDDVNRDMKEIDTITTQLTEEVTKLTEKKKSEIEAN